MSARQVGRQDSFSPLRSKSCWKMFLWIPFSAVEAGHWLLRRLAFPRVFLADAGVGWGNAWERSSASSCVSEGTLAPCGSSVGFKLNRRPVAAPVPPLLSLINPASTAIVFPGNFGRFCGAKGLHVSLLQQPDAVALKERSVLVQFLVLW